MDQLTIPDVTVVAELGRGAQTAVYRIRRHATDYALKTYLGLTVEGGDPVASFRREAALMALAAHPALPEVFEIGEAGGQPYLIMELIDGAELARALRAGPLPAHRVIDLGVQVAEALAAAHRVGLVHRDVKPQNILLDRDGTARIIDFSLATMAAKQIDDDAVAGTLAYAAPEQSGTLHRQVDARADLYSLGVVLYESATGQLPFDSDDVGELLHLHATTAPPDPRSVNSEVPVALAAVITKLMAKDPDDRYPDCPALVADLTAVAAAPDAPFTPGDRPAPAAPPGPPFVGRDAELSALLGAWERTGRGTGAVAVVRGSVGSGKSRVAAALVDQVDTADAAVLSARAAADCGPLSPLSEAVEGYLTQVRQRSAAERDGLLDQLSASIAPVASILRSFVPTLVPADQPDGEPPVDGLVPAVADLITALARSAGRAVLVIDDAKWLDSVSERVLSELTRRLASIPLLLVVTLGATDDLPDWASTAEPVVNLEPLNRAAAAQLLRGAAGRLQLSDEMVDRISGRSGNQPLALTEYLEAVVEAGLLWPDWGRWVLDVDGLDRLGIADDITDLLLRRVSGLGPNGRAALTVAAAVGVRFDPALVAAAADLDAADVTDVLQHAARQGVLEQRGSQLAFVHTHIRKALLDEYEPERLSDLHERIAGALDDAPDDVFAGDPAHVFALARHRRQGHPEHDPQRAITACVVAGRRSLDAYASTEATEFLEAARELANRFGVAFDHEAREALADAYRLAGRVADAITVLLAALDVAPAGLPRGRILNRLAKLRLEEWDLSRAQTMVDDGLAELGSPLPRSNMLLLLRAVLASIAAMFIERTGIGFGTRDADRRARLELVLDLCESGMVVAGFLKQMGRTLAIGQRSTYFVARLGLSPAYVRRKVVNSLFQHYFLRVRGKGLQRAAKAAQRLGDPAIITYVDYAIHLIPIHTGKIDGDASLRWLDSHRAMLQLVDYLGFAHALTTRLLLTGHAQQAVSVYHTCATRLSPADLEKQNISALGLLAAAAVGDGDERWRGLGMLESDALAFQDPIIRTPIVMSYLGIALERREYGPVLDRLLAEVDATGFKPTFGMAPYWLLFVYVAFALLERARLASDTQRAAAVRAADKAVRDLTATARYSPLRAPLRAHLRAAQAHQRQLRGDHEGAIRVINEAERLLREADTPLASYEAARIHARSLLALGAPAAAKAKAAAAVSIAQQFGWPHRVFWVTQEFDVGATSRHSSTQGLNRTTMSGTADRRRLAALEQLSVTAARIVDPDQLIRIALRETIRILNAERALLFLIGADEQLDLHIGLDAAGNELDERGGHASTVIERVRLERQPIVLTGTEEGATLGSASVVLHGLRSILAAPLLLDNRLLGVIYLDSRVAKGVFTAADIGILTALTNHVAAALETARAAQLAVAVQSAERKRDVAEQLRHAMTNLAGALNPDEVLHRLGASFAQLLPGGFAFLVRSSGEEGADADASSVEGKLSVTLATGEPDATVQLIARDRHAEELLAGVYPVAGGAAALAGTALGGIDHPAGLGSVADTCHSWLAVPLRDGDLSVGLLLLSAAAADGFGQTEIEIAAALAGEGMVAYGKARLFLEVEYLATTDALTGVLNRGRFFTLGESRFRRALAQREDVLVIMTDIDHFKRVNDKYGHHVGDQVIQAVADRMRQVLRPDDLLGRYGGEEFAAVLVGVHANMDMIGERLRQSIANVPVRTDAGELPITSSVGVSAALPDGDSLAAALERADAALYHSKKGGRNRVTVG